MNFLKSMYVIFFINPFVNNKIKYTIIYIVSYLLFSFGNNIILYNVNFPKEIEYMDNLHGRLDTYYKSGRSSHIISINYENNIYKFRCYLGDESTINVLNNIGKDVTVYYRIDYGFFDQTKVLEMLIFGSEVLVKYDYNIRVKRYNLFAKAEVISIVFMFIMLIYVYKNNKKIYRRMWWHKKLRR